jgi:hypothetical protein
MWTAAVWGLALALGRPELALQEPISAGDVPPGEVRLEWRTSEGWRRVEQQLLFGGPPIASPRTSLSPLVVRPQVGRKGIEGRLVAGEGVDLAVLEAALEVRLIEHGRLDEVLVAREQSDEVPRPWLIESWETRSLRWSGFIPSGASDRGAAAKRDGLEASPVQYFHSLGGVSDGRDHFLLTPTGRACSYPEDIIPLDRPVPIGACTANIPVSFEWRGSAYPVLVGYVNNTSTDGYLCAQDYGIDQFRQVLASPVDPEASIDFKLSRDLERNEIGLRIRRPSPQPEASWTICVQLAGDLAAPRVSPDRGPSKPMDARTPGVAFSAWTPSSWPVHLEGPREQLDIRPTMGPGVALGDADGDGDLELYAVQGAGSGRESKFGNELFTDLALEAGPRVVQFTGAEDQGAGMGALFFDAAGDGDLDLYVANYGPDSLYENDPGEKRWDGRFHDVSEAAGVRGADRAALWSAGVCAGDPDRDGDLDLYVTSYLEYDESQMPSMENLPYAREDPVAMLPFAFPGQRNTYLENQSDAEGLKFVDRTAELGVLDVQGRGMQPVFWDYDQDGSDDLYIANDVSLNVLYKARTTEAGFGFRDVSFQTGLDDPRGGMGLALGDVDGDLDEDVFLTNWQLETNALYLNNLLSHDSQKHRVASFRDSTVEAGFGPFGVGVTSWGCELFDLELDGDLDLFVANGYTSPDYESTGICVGQPNHLYLGDGEGRFAPAFDKLGAFGSEKLPSRAALAADLDRDGDLDLVVTANNSALRILRNGVEREGRWLGLQLRGQGANTHAIGARVIVRAGELEHLRVLRAGTSYLAGNAPELHFGLGAVERIDEVEVHWPSGRVTRHADLELDAWQTLAEPAN